MVLVIKQLLFARVEKVIISQKQLSKLLDKILIIADDTRKYIMKYVIEAALLKMT